MKTFQHVSHGYTHAYNPTEEARLIAQGWIEVVPKIIVPEPKRRGRKPHPKG